MYYPKKMTDPEESSFAAATGPGSADRDLRRNLAGAAILRRDESKQ